MNTKPVLNQILYGPPGTGKTYNTVVEAIKIIDKNIINYDDNGNVINYDVVKAEFDKYKEQGRIEFVTFHQSYSYEEFVEGIKSYINGNVLQFIKDGIFKEFCNRKTTIEDKYNYFKYLYDIKKLPNEFKSENGKNYFISKFDDSTFEITRIGGTTNSCTTEKFKNAVLLECGDLKSTNLRKKAGVGNGLEMNIIELRNYIRQLEVPKVLIIDEINRGNISKIFGELITLIEPDKRLGKEHALKVKLPYSQDEFGVPRNLYIIGTMNTSDKSLSLSDAALRRRFEFKPMYPKRSGFENSEILNALNDEILKRKKSADYLIGHSYFMSDDTLVNIFNHKVIPLLMEYFDGKIKDVKELLENVFDIENAWKKEYEYINDENEKDYYYLQLEEETNVIIK